MKLFSKLKRAATNIVLAGIPPAGRSSKDEYSTLLGGVQSYYGWFNELSPAIPYNYLEYLTRIAFINPTLKNAITNWKVLANSGHEAIIQDANENKAIAAKDALNQLAFRINRMGAGMDGLIDDLLLQTSIGGATSCEGVISKNRSGLYDIVVVPVARIRFKYEDGKHVPYQRLSNSKEIKLNELTYKYAAWERWENNPYGIPPLLSALQSVIDGVEIDKNIRFMFRKFGILGLVSFIVSPPRNKKPTGESDSEYQSYLSSHLTSVSEALQKNYNNGMLVHYDDQKVEHHNTTGDARGADALYMQNIHKIASGAITPPAFLGYSDSVTETFADVVYRIYIRLTENLRRPVKRSLEEMWRLELLLKRIDVEWVSMGFAPVPQRDPQSEAQANDFKVRTAITKAKSGMVDPDEAARELGYDNWFNPDRIDNAGSGFANMSLSANKNIYRFKFNRNRNLYEHNRPSIIIPHTHSTGCNCHLSVKLSDGWNEVENRITDYFNSLEDVRWDAKEEGIIRLLAFLKSHKYTDFPDAESFARDAYLEVVDGMEGVFAKPEIARTLRDQVTPIYTYFRLQDKGGLPSGSAFEFRFNPVDTRTLKFMEKTDQFFLSKFISNEQAQSSGVNFLKEQYLEHGEAIFGRTSGDAIRAFRSQFDDYLTGRTDSQVQSIIDSSVQRMRGYGRTQQFKEAGFTYKELIPLDSACDICEPLRGKRIEIAPAVRQMELEIEMTADEFREHLRGLPSDRSGLQSKYISGDLLVPLHPNCHCQERVVLADE